ncbi:MAG: ABC transporter ATP-binding protein [Gemella sp.]|nr:ABC transporter ATP-binding protein [Gemella sp.]
MKIWKYRSVKLAILFVMLVSLVEVAMSYSLAYLVVKTTEELYRNALIVLGIFLINALFMYVNTKVKSLAGYYVSQDLKQKADKYISTMSHQKFYEKDYGERLSVYINDVTSLLGLTLTRYLSMVEKAFTTIFIIVALFTIHYSMVLLAIVSLVLMVGVPGLFQAKLSAHMQNVQTGKEKYLGKMRELLQGFDTFLENSAFSIFLGKSRKAAFEYATTVYKAEKFAGIMSAALTFVNSLVTVLALSLVSYFAIQGKVAEGMFLAVTALLPSFGEAVMGFLSEKEFYKSGLDLYQTRFAELDKEEFSEEKYLTGIRSKKLAGFSFVEKSNNKKSVENIKMTDVVINFADKSITLPKDIEFNKGMKYAIIGESGSGKSTLLNVVLGKLENFTGSKKVDGVEENDAMFDRVAYVNQHTFLFNDTVRANIDMFNKYDDSKLEETLRRLRLENISLDTVLEDNGKNLSGGQRQRLAIARSLLREKEMLILDEATSALDEKTAIEIEELAFENASTVIMVSHHLSEKTKARLDKIIELG